MVPLKLFLFSAPRLERDGKVLPIGRRKVIAMLAYLAVTGRLQQRDHILALLWPGFDTASARNNLRRDLSFARKLLGTGFIQSDHNQVSLPITDQFWLDIAAFREHLSTVAAHHPGNGTLCPNCLLALQQAIDLAATGFMAGFSLADAPEFNEWLFFRHQELNALLAEALQSLEYHHSQAGRYEVAIHLARRWLELDPYHEPAHRRLMQLYTWTGQHATALKQYEDYRLLLAKEFGAKPTLESEQLAAAIRTQRLDRPALAKLSEVETVTVNRDPLQREIPAQFPIGNLPLHTTPFFGREQELTEIAARLANPDCRLLTILGAGGMGKTRLAIATALDQLDEFSDGIIFVPLAPVAPPDAATAFNPLAGALADALSISFHGQDTPEQQLISFLRTREQLLIFDNFEQLLPVATFVSDLLYGAPSLKVLVTSRERLHLQEEWLFPLQGLAVSASLLPHKVPSGAAVELFAQRALQVQPTFNLADEYEAVLRICKLIEGMPLGLELAAAWVFQLSCAEIANEIAATIDFLTTKMRNVPDRHRSIRSVFAHSWERLTLAERDILQKLSVFRSGFDRAAAKVIAGASLSTLASLVSKSLLTPAEDGRYVIHELLRQFAAEKLAADDRLEQETKAAHTRHFMELMRRQAPRQSEPTISEVSQNIDNIRLATHHAAQYQPHLFDRLVGETLAAHSMWLRLGSTYRLLVDRLQVAYELAEVDNSTDALPHLLNLVRYQLMLAQTEVFSFLSEPVAAAEVANRALKSLPQTSDPAVQELQGFGYRILGSTRYLEGDFRNAASYWQKSLAFFQELEQTEYVAFCLLDLFNAYLLTGEFDAAARCLATAKQLSTSVEEEIVSLRIWNEMGKLATIHGQLEEADSYFRESLVKLEANGLHHLIVFVWREWGDALRLQGHFELARTNYQRSLASAKNSNQLYQQTQGLWSLGNLAVAEGANETALQYFEEYKKMSPLTQEYPGGPGWALLGLGKDEEARQAFAASLQLLRYQARPIALDALVGMAHLKARSGEHQEALAFLALVRSHPSSHHESQEKARQLWESLTVGLPADLIAQTKVLGDGLDLEVTVASLLDPR